MTTFQRTDIIVTTRADLADLRVWSDEDGNVYVSRDQIFPSVVTIAGTYRRDLLAAMVHAADEPDSDFRFSPEPAATFDFPSPGAS